MGGCRCHFRSCKVNSYNCPGTHFFRFPLKDKERCDQWVKYTQRHELYSLPETRRRNLTICIRHFRDECFMNYKKDKPNATAVPTIHRFSPNLALDYEQDIESGVLTTLQEPKQPHLIPPPGFECPFGFVNGGEDISVVIEGNNDEVSECTREIIKEDKAATISNKHTLKTNRVNKVNPIPCDGIDLIVENIRCNKRQLTCLLTEKTAPEEDETYAKASKKPKTNQQQLDDDSNCSVILQENFAVYESPEKPSHTIIINHQIMEAEEHIYDAMQASDTFSLEDSGSYRLVHNKQQLPETNDDFQQEDHLEEHLDQQCDTNYLNLTQKLQEATVEINCLQEKLKKEMEKTKTLENKNSSSQLTCQNLQKQITTFKADIESLQNEKVAMLESKSVEMHDLKMQLNEEKQQRTNVEKDLTILKQEQICNKNDIIRLKTIKTEALKRSIQNKKQLNDMESKLAHEYEQKLQAQQETHLTIEQHLQQQVSTLEQSLNLSSKQLADVKNELSQLKTEYASIKSESLAAGQKVLVLESQLENLQKLYDNKDEENTNMQRCNDSLSKTNEKLKADLKMLASNQNQVSTVTTSIGNNAASAAATISQPAASNVLTKAQIFNAIKRYISSSMCALLRMEMFGNTEREWKSDERQVSIDLLRLGEFVYKYIMDEWRFRLPPLRDVRIWLNQSAAAVDEEEDL